jgi:hypothetical protein
MKSTTCAIGRERIFVYNYQMVVAIEEKRATGSARGNRRIFFNPPKSILSSSSDRLVTLQERIEALNKEKIAFEKFPTKRNGGRSIDDAGPIRSGNQADRVGLTS